ncbi:MAG: hypothetical protein ACKOEM_09450 [Planctomycetia bacterium]
MKTTLDINDPLRMEEGLQPSVRLPLFKGRGGLVATVLLLLLSMFAAVLATAAQPDGRRAVELTFLKSNPGQRERLKTFIELNWFAMDRVAKEQGLMSDYTVMDTGTDEGAWNILVSVTYMDEKGYDGIVEAFERIRRAHTTVLVDGKGFRDLGSIVESKRVFEGPVGATPASTPP